MSLSENDRDERIVEMQRPHILSPLGEDGEPYVTWTER